MKRLLHIAIVAALALPAFGAARADDKADIKAVYDKITTAMRAKDTKAIAALGTVDFTEKQANGKTYTAKESMAEMEKHFKSIKKFNELKMNIRSLTINGKKAVANVDFKLAAVTIEGGKPHDLKVTGTTKDTLVKTAQGWKFKSVEAISEETTVDGQKMGGAPPAQAHKGGPIKSRH